MSVAAPSTRARAGLRARIAVTPTVIALAGLAVLIGLLVVLTWATWGDLESDIGYDTVAGTRVADGELPYRDFIYFYGPLAPALVGLVSLVAGAGIGSTLAVGLAVTAAILAATFVLGRALAGIAGAVLATGITAAVAFTPDNYNYVMPHTNAATLGTAFVLGILLTIWRFASTRQERWLVLAGCALGLVTLTKPEPLLGAIAALAAWLVVTRRDGDVRRRLALLGAPAAAIAAAVYVPLLALVGPNRLVFENLYPVDFLEAAGNVELHGRMPFTIESFVDLGGKLVLYAVGAAVLLLAGNAIARGGRLGTVVLVGVGLAGAAAVAGAFLNPEALRHGLEFAYGWIPAGAIAMLVVLFRRTPSSATPVAQLQVALTAALAAVAATTYPGFFPHAPHEQIAAYYMPLAALFIVSLHLVDLPRTRPAVALGAGWLAFLALAGAGLAVKDARADSVSVTGRGGTIAEQPETAQAYQAALGWIERTTAPGEPIFIAPMLTGLYALSARPSPLEQISMMPGALPTPPDERRAISTLEAAKVRLVLTDDRTLPVWGQGPFGDTYNRELAQWIERAYDRVATMTVAAYRDQEGNHPVRHLYVWLRKGA